MKRALVAGLVVAAGLVLALPADAMYQPVQNVSAEQGSDATFGPIPGNYPGNAVAVPTPSGCGNEDGAGPFTPFCHTVPIQVKPPKLADTDEYFITIEVSWDNPTEQNDLDIYAWDDRQISRRADPESGSYTQLSESASADNPEVIKIFHPDLGRYNLVVINFAGPNTGYRVKASLTIARGDAIFELLEPTSKPKEPKKDEAAAPIDFSAPPPAGTAPASPFLPPTAGLDEVAVLPDTDLDAGFGASTFTSDLRPPQDEFAARRISDRVGPASGVAVATSLVVLPVLALVAGATLMARRRRFGLAT